MTTMELSTVPGAWWSFSQVKYEPGYLRARKRAPGRRGAVGRCQLLVLSTASLAALLADLAADFALSATVWTVSPADFRRYSRAISRSASCSLRVAAAFLPAALRLASFFLRVAAAFSPAASRSALVCLGIPPWFPKLPGAKPRTL